MVDNVYPHTYFDLLFMSILKDIGCSTKCVVFVNGKKKNYNNPLIKSLPNRSC